MTKDESIRGPNRLQGISSIVQRLRAEAEDAEVNAGLEEAKVEVKEETENGVKKEGMDVDEDGEVKVKTEKKIKVDPFKEQGIIGQEAVKMRRELRKKRQEEYKKSAENTCELGVGSC